MAEIPLTRVEDELPTGAGTFTIRMTNWTGNQRGPHFLFNLYGGIDNLWGIPLKPSPKGWDWDEDEDYPTIMPSINVIGKAHGWVTSGVWRDA